MNDKARELGLTDTHFSRPDGLDAPRHYSSARDVFSLARVAMRTPVIRKTVRIRTATIQGGRPLRSWNDLLFTYAGTIGVKTGHTDEAGWSEVAAVRRNGVTLYAVLLGGPTREQRNAALVRLLEWGFDQYRRIDAVQQGRAYAEVALPFSDDRLRVVAPAAVSASVLVDHALVERIVTPTLAELPVEKGERLGEVRVFDGDRLVASSPQPPVRGL
jgi:D-alanyl-D-alanine carboxypeptidase (penicillin-binding protein 5/6)